MAFWQRFLVLVGLSLALWSCKETVSVPPNPTISFSSGIGIVDRDIDRAPGSQLSFKIIANRSNEPMQNIRVFRNNTLLQEYGTNGVKTLRPTEQNTFRDSMSFKLPDSLGVYVFRFEVRDNGGKIGFSEIKIQSKVPDIQYDSSILLFAQGARIQTDSVPGKPFGQFLRMSPLRVFDSAHAFTFASVLSLGAGSIDGTEMYFISPDAYGNFGGLYALPAAAMMSFDSSSVDFDNVSGTYLSNMQVGSRNYIRAVTDSVYRFDNKRDRKGLIKVLNTEWQGTNALNGKVLFSIKSVGY